MSDVVKSSISVVVTFLSSIVFVLAILSIPASIGVGSTVFAEGCDESEMTWHSEGESECSDGMEIQGTHRVTVMTMKAVGIVAMPKLRR